MARVYLPRPPRGAHGKGALAEWVTQAMVLLDVFIVVDIGVVAWLDERNRETLSEDMWQALHATNERAIRGFAVGLAICLVATVLAFVWRTRERRKLAAALERLRGQVEEGGGLLAQEFLARRRELLARGDFTGIYVLRNARDGRCYVGQSVRVLGRVTQHLTGHGNGDVYADLVHGDDFRVFVRPLSGSGYDSLDDLEREAIAAYDAYDHGYNRTRGNGG